MVKLVKSSVKCYKKKTKKMVGGQSRTYEYDQYLVPLKTSDTLNCSMEVFVIPQDDLVDFMDEDGKIEENFLGKDEEYQRRLEDYETELAELEWKHGELSRSYKELFKKYNKSRKRREELEDRIKQLKKDREKLTIALKKEKDDNQVLKNAYEKELKKNKILEEEMNHEVNDKISNHKKVKDDVDGNYKETDIWNVLRSRLIKKEQEDGKDR
jgi:chromosome segregation ATPase